MSFIRIAGIFVNQRPKDQGIAMDYFELLGTVEVEFFVVSVLSCGNLAV